MPSLNNNLARFDDLTQKIPFVSNRLLEAPFFADAPVFLHFRAYHPSILRTVIPHKREAPSEPKACPGESRERRCGIRFVFHGDRNKIGFRKIFLHQKVQENFA
ncbi:MAG TPA: hypothetical protein VMV79_02395, partial [Alphaproteobacteria bacterium]|nr:hypothetical protein [Alphaproteobacteria bacterium]